jgi:hypothetical protein
LGLVKVTSDIVFDEANGSPREQVDLYDVDEDEVTTATIRIMAISVVRPQEQDQPSFSTMVKPPTQDEEQVPQEEGMNQGELRKKRTRREKYHRHLQLKSGPPFKGSIWWIKSMVTSVRE